MRSQQYFKLTEADEIKGAISSEGSVCLLLGEDVELSMTEPQAREVLDTLIDLVSESRGQGMAA